MKTPALFLVDKEPRYRAPVLTVRTLLPAPRPCLTVQQPAQTQSPCLPHRSTQGRSMRGGWTTRQPSRCGACSAHAWGRTAGSLWLALPMIPPAEKDRSK